MIRVPRRSSFGCLHAQLMRERRHCSAAAGPSFDVLYWSANASRNPSYIAGYLF